mmetsp:Transcript_13902/g.26723  ORF Transcript_13902/g.26723 Transcript_13902/m.26723 type:complete len:216 (+) Transcript_13902:171-818(+)
MDNTLILNLGVCAMLSRRVTPCSASSTVSCSLILVRMHFMIAKNRGPVSIFLSREAILRGSSFLRRVHFAPSSSLRLFQVISNSTALLGTGHSFSVDGDGHETGRGFPLSFCFVGESSTFPSFGLSFAASPLSFSPAPYPAPPLALFSSAATLVLVGMTCLSSDFVCCESLRSTTGIFTLDFNFSNPSFEQSASMSLILSTFKAWDEGLNLNAAS